MSITNSDFPSDEPSQEKKPSTSPYNLGFTVEQIPENQSVFCYPSMFKKCELCGKELCCDICRAMCM